MKKIVSFLVALIICLSASVATLADVGAPPFNNFYVYVSNPEGAPLYNTQWNGNTLKMQTTSIVIPYNTKLEITGDYVFGNKSYGSINYHGEYGYIDMDDCSIEAPSVGIDKAFKASKSTPFIVVIKEGTHLYAGPSFAYKKIGEKLPYGTQFEAQYYDQEHEKNWAYITYKGTGGWIHVYQYSNVVCGHVVDQDSRYTGKIIISYSGIKLTETFEYNSKVLVNSLPIGTELAFKYYVQNPQSAVAFVDYNGKKGWVVIDNGYEVSAGYSSKACILVHNQKGVTLYSSPNYNSKVVGNLPFNSNLKTSYTQPQSDSTSNYRLWYRVTYNGITGWAEGSDYIAASESVSECKVKSGNNPVVYSSPKSSSKSLGTLPSNAKVLSGYSHYNDSGSWEYVKYENIAGWVASDQLETVKEITDRSISPTSIKGKDTPVEQSKIESSAEESKQEPNVPAELVENPESDVEVAKAKSKINLTPIIIIVLCLGTAIVVAVTAVVIIILINKKNKTT